MVQMAATGRYVSVGLNPLVLTFLLPLFSTGLNLTLLKCSQITTKPIYLGVVGGLEISLGVIF